MVLVERECGGEGGVEVVDGRMGEKFGMVVMVMCWNCLK